MQEELNKKLQLVRKLIFNKLSEAGQPTYLIETIGVDFVDNFNFIAICRYWDTPAFVTLNEKDELINFAYISKR